MPKGSGPSRLFRATAIVMVVVIAALLGGDAWLMAQRVRYRREIDRLTASMTTIERDRAREIIAHEQDRVQIALELLRRQAKRERDLHLSITIDSSSMYLESEGAVLREMPIHIGPERRVGITPDTVHLATPRGARTIARVLTDADVWQVPPWVYADRGIAPAENRSVRAGLGPVALLLDGGTVIYSLAADGPLADSTYVMPGAVRARAEDLRAILPSLKPGLRVYFY